MPSEDAVGFGEPSSEEAAVLKPDALPPRPAALVEAPPDDEEELTEALPVLPPDKR